MRSQSRVLLLACLALLAAGPAAADPLLLTIQPIQICNDGGSACANAGRELFEEVGNEIWTQADIWFDFLGWVTVFETDLLDTTFAFLTSPNHGQNENELVINLWFVNTITDCGGSAFPYGCGYVDGNGVAIANSVFAANRIDTIAHELGHNLGLEHTTDALNLEASGAYRLVPGSIDDVYPRGGKRDQLYDWQIAIARSSGFLTAYSTPDTGVPVPEPASLTLVLTGAAIVALHTARARRRRR